MLTTSPREYAANLIWSTTEHMNGVTDRGARLADAMLPQRSWHSRKYPTCIFD
jgi:hypothetical protein